jgi:hypothetical protein
VKGKAGCSVIVGAAAATKLHSLEHEGNLLFVDRVCTIWANYSFSARFVVILIRHGVLMNEADLRRKQNRQHYPRVVGPPSMTWVLGQDSRWAGRDEWDARRP